MGTLFRALPVRRYGFGMLRFAAWSVAILVTVFLVFIGRALIARLLGLIGIGPALAIATFAISACVLWLLLPRTGDRRRALIGSSLVLLAAFDWVITEAAVALYGPQAPLAHGFGPFTPGTAGEWSALLARFEMAWWAVLFAAGLVLLITARGGRTPPEASRPLSPASASAKLEGDAGA